MLDASRGAAARLIPSAEPNRRLGHVRALDGMRGAAVLFVVLMHAYDVPSGAFLGVEIFFALSGFSLCAAAVSYRLVEQPFLRYTDRVAARRKPMPLVRAAGAAAAD